MEDIEGFFVEPEPNNTRAVGELREANHILELAREKGVALRQDASLSEELSTLDVGGDIPDKLYPAISEVFAFLYRI